MKSPHVRRRAYPGDTVTATLVAWVGDLQYTLPGDDASTTGDGRLDGSLTTLDLAERLNERCEGNGAPSLHVRHVIHSIPPGQWLFAGYDVLMCVDV